LNKIGAYTARIIRVVFVYDEGITVIAIEAVSSGKPHEASAILNDVGNITLRQAIVRGEVSELEVALLDTADPRTNTLILVSRRVSCRFVLRGRAWRRVLGYDYRREPLSDQPRFMGGMAGREPGVQPKTPSAARHHDG
jgi:hypothetical protein